MIPSAWIVYCTTSMDSSVSCWAITGPEDTSPISPMASTRHGAQRVQHLRARQVIVLVRVDLLVQLPHGLVDVLMAGVPDHPGDDGVQLPAPVQVRGVPLEPLVQVVAHVLP